MRKIKFPRQFAKRFVICRWCPHIGLSRSAKRVACRRCNRSAKSGPTRTWMAKHRPWRALRDAQLARNACPAPKAG